MKRVRVTIHPGDADLPRTFERVAAADEPFVRVRVVNWNVTADPAAFLLRLTGDVDRFESILAADDGIEEYDLLRVSATEGYCFVTGPGTADARALWAHFKGPTLMTVPPAEWNPDGSYTFTLVGREGDIQAAVEAAPSGARVEIESVGGRTVAPESVVHRLSDRQRAAVRAALDLGYYDVPRTATTEDVAGALGCATSTAAEHLRKAESTVLAGLFAEGRGEGAPGH
mgnify:CR=1 FL=1